MHLDTEIKLDFDRSVTSDERFAIKKSLKKFVGEVNLGNLDSALLLFDESVVVLGFDEFVLYKPQYQLYLRRKFDKRGEWQMRFPELKFSKNKGIYYLIGRLEEYKNLILASEGSITINLVKNDSGFKIYKINFSPRMLLKNED